MKFIEKLLVIQRVDKLIRMKATGSPNDLAYKLGLSRSTVYDIIDCMKQMGAEINYSKSERCFYYEQEKILALGFVEKTKTYGGKNQFFFERPIFSDAKNISLLIQS